MNEVEKISNDLNSRRVFFKDIKKVKYEHHEASKIQPSMDEKDFSSLKNDVILVGKILEPIVIYDNKILDGRHRQKVCIDLNLPMPIKELKGKYSIEGLKEWVRSKHMNRNLTKRQSEAMAFEYKDSIANVSWEDAAKRYGVGTSSVRRYQTLYNLLKSNNLENDFDRVLKVMKKGKILLSAHTAKKNGFIWIYKNTGSLSSALQQLKSFIENETIISNDDIDPTEIDRSTGEIKTKEKNIFIEDTVDINTENQNLKALLSFLITKIPEINTFIEDFKEEQQIKSKK